MFSLDAAGPLNCDPCYGTLTIDQVSLHTSAWCAPDLSALWGSPLLRGQNRLIPGRQGRKPYKRRIDEFRFSLPLLVTGYCDSDGFAYSDAGVGFDQGLEANVAYLQNALVIPPSNNDSTRDATFTLPSGNVRQSTVQILGLTGQLLPGALFRATLELVDVDGLLLVGGQNFV